MPQLQQPLDLKTTMTALHRYAATVILVFSECDYAACIYSSSIFSSSIVSDSAERVSAAATATQRRRHLGNSNNGAAQQSQLQPLQQQLQALHKSSASVCDTFRRPRPTPVFQHQRRATHGVLQRGNHPITSLESAAFACTGALR
jgi:hypothetical protein